MRRVNIALLGFGNVGQAFAELVLQKADEIRNGYHVEIVTTGIMTSRHGTVIDPRGVNLSEALSLVGTGRSLGDMNMAGSATSNIEFIRSCGAQALLENTPVNYENGEPAVSHIRTAFECGMHAITANKGPIVHSYHELVDLASSRDVQFRFEATVMDGAPIFSLWRESLPGARLIKFRGVLNSTTNLILTLMEKGKSFDDSIQYAQSIGVAETDPSGDIDGWDAAVKVAALVTVLMDVPVKPVDINPEGIRTLSRDDVLTATSEGKRWKLVCEAERLPDSVRTSVMPMLVDRDDPLYTVSGTSSAITFETDVLGDLTILETDPGPKTTAYGLLADLLGLVRSGRFVSSGNETK